LEAVAHFRVMPAVKVTWPSGECTRGLLDFGHLGGNHARTSIALLSRSGEVEQDLAARTGRKRAPEPSTVCHCTLEQSSTIEGTPLESTLVHGVLVTPFESTRTREGGRFLATTVRSRSELSVPSPNRQVPSLFSRCVRLPEQLIEFLIVPVYVVEEVRLLVFLGHCGSVNNQHRNRTRQV